MKKRHKNWLVENNINTLDELVTKIEELKNTVGLDIVDRQMLMDFCYYVSNKSSVLNSFFRENEIIKVDKKYSVLKDTVMDNITKLLQKEMVADWHSEESSPMDEAYIKFMQNINHVEAYRVINPHIKFTILEQNTLTDTEQENIKTNSTRHKSRQGETHNNQGMFFSCLSI